MRERKFRKNEYQVVLKTNYNVQETDLKVFNFLYGFLRGRYNILYDLSIYPFFLLQIHFFYKHKISKNLKTLWTQLDLNKTSAKRN